MFQSLQSPIDSLVSVKPCLKCHSAVLPNQLSPWSASTVSPSSLVVRNRCTSWWCFRCSARLIIPSFQTPPPLPINSFHIKHRRWSIHVEMICTTETRRIWYIRLMVSKLATAGNFTSLYELLPLLEISPPLSFSYLKVDSHSFCLVIPGFHSHSFQMILTHHIHADPLPHHTHAHTHAHTHTHTHAHTHTHTHMLK